MFALCKSNIAVYRLHTFYLARGELILACIRRVIHVVVDWVRPIHGSWVVGFHQAVAAVPLLRIKQVSLQYNTGKPHYIPRHIW